MFDAETATSLARVANDRLAEVVRRHPTRYAALASFAPQDPRRAVQEMERAIRTLKFSGFMVNSHTNNEYLDQPRYWPILEAAEALDAPLYIHPRAPSDGMAGPFRDYRLEGAAWGYGVETGTHAVRLMLSGVLDRFPKLRVVIGHMGEALPFWMWRLDFMAAPGARAAGRSNQLKPSEYFQRNFAITTSGVEDPLALRYCIDKIGADHIMWAIDYPYQPTGTAVAFIESAPYPRCNGNRLPMRTRSESSVSMRRIEPASVRLRCVNVTQTRSRRAEGQAPSWHRFASEPRPPAHVPTRGITRVQAG
jgi:predicted TIM-barrel fold metal-dependent hydrolase